MGKVSREPWHFGNWTGLHLRLFFEILSVNGCQIMWSFLSYKFIGLIVFGCLRFFLIEIATISSIWVESISLRVNDIISITFFMRIWSFFDELWTISSRRVERLFVWIVLVIFDKDSGFGNTFCSKLFEILRCGVEWYIFLFVFHPWHYLLSHLWLLPWEMFSISWVDIVIRAIGLSLWINTKLLSGGGFCQVLMGCGWYYFW